MWITTLTLNLVALRAMDAAERTNVLSAATQKKDELKVIDGAGLSTVEHPAPTSLEEIPISNDELIIKRAWNHEANAQAFVDHFSVCDWATATLADPG